MVTKVSLKADLSSIEDFAEFKRDFREEVIEKSLDEPLKKSLSTLKSELTSLVDDQVRDQQPADKVDLTQPAEPRADLPLASKSTEDIIKFLTEADPKKAGQNRNIATLEQNKFITTLGSSNVDGSYRADIRIDIIGDETVEDHYRRAVDLFREATFAIPNAKGGFDYFVNAGEDVSDSTKIDCSTFTGFGDEEPDKGMSPARRFEKDKKKGYSTWTLKQDFVKRMQRGQTKHVNLNPIIDRIKDGDYAEAANFIDSLPKNEQTKQISVQVEKLSAGKDLPVNLDNYLSIKSLIGNLRIQKTIKKDSVIYKLISTSTGAGGREDVKFLEASRRILTLWLVSNHNKWFSKMVEVTKRIIKKFEG